MGAPPAARLAAWFGWLCAHEPLWQEYRNFCPHRGSYMSLMRCPRELLVELQVGFHPGAVSGQGLAVTTVEAALTPLCGGSS